MKVNEYGEINIQEYFTYDTAAYCPFLATINSQEVQFATIYDESMIALNPIKEEHIGSFTINLKFKVYHPQL